MEFTFNKSKPIILAEIVRKNQKIYICLNIYDSKILPLKLELILMVFLQLNHQ